ncbi:MAG: hypothetical protein ACYSUI_21350 [Planctomycetota bacterium]|jgi:hypothetical protein
MKGAAKSIALGQDPVVVISACADEVERAAVSLFQRRVQDRAGLSLRVTEVSGGWEKECTAASSLIVVGRVGDHPLVPALLDALGSEQPAEPDSYLLFVGEADERMGGILPGVRRLAVVGGADPRAVVYGIGRLLRLVDLDDLRLPVAPTLEEHAPVGKTRGVYCATHFNNWYEAAPLEEVQEYIEDLALWGVNALWTWFDMNWYPPGFWRDPESRGMRMVERVKAIHRAAGSLGLEVGLIGVANEGFRGQPAPELRADMSARRGGFYPYSQICPSQPGGLELILENRRRVLALIGPVDAFCCWPYDQGGCGCKDCADADGWGKTFLGIGPEIARTVRSVNPDIRFFLSTWYMSDGELELVRRQAERQGRWFDGLLLETRRVGQFEPGKELSLLVFPEISMFDCFFVSYGCNGANPAPRRFSEEATQIASLGYGTALYSEGLYEDLNKVIWTAKMWEPNRAPEDIVAEYSRHYFGRRNGKAGRDLILGLEQTWGANKLHSTPREVTARLLRLAQSLEQQLPTALGCRRRWQVLLDRARLDDLMVELGPDTELLTDIKRLFDEASFPDDCESLRRQAERLCGRLRKRVDGVEALFGAYWQYLRRFHLEGVTLVFRPDQFLGRADYRGLLEACGKSLQQADEQEMRRLLLQGIHRWFWFNGVDVDFLFL